MTSTGSERARTVPDPSRRFDLLQVHNRYRDPGGEDAVVAAERAVLTAAGHQVAVHEVQNPSASLAAAGALALSPWNPFSAMALGRVIDTHRPELAHVHNTWYSLSSSVLATLRRRRVPTVMTLHNYRVTCLNGQLFRDGAVCQLCLGRPPYPGIGYRCYRGSLPASLAVAGAVGIERLLGLWEETVELFVVMTEFSRLLLRTAGLPGDRVRVKPHFVADRGRRSTPPSESGTVLFVGRLSSEKGVDGLVEAWAQAETADLTLRIVGDGPLRAALEQRRVPGVELTGWLDPSRVSAELRSARALAVPSIWYEPFGLVLIEGMAAGLPIIASDIGGMPEVVGEVDPTFLPAPGDVAAWSESLSMLAAGGDELDAAGAAGRQRYESRYTPEAGLAGLERIYVETLARSF
jgi:glycosyltransferase involved in cell wall biosynthesis